MIRAVIRRAPRPELSPFIARLWASAGAASAGAASAAAASAGAASAGAASAADRELMVPTGAMHVVIRIDEPLRVFDRIDAAAPRAIGHAIIGGTRAAPYIRDVSRPVSSVGAQLRPGVAGLLLGASGRALAGRHTLLDDLWGRAAGELREQLAHAADPAERLDRFEAALLARLPRVRGVHPAVAHALARFAATDDVAAVVDEVGYSHRRFIALFDDAVGLTPKRYCRVQRLQRALVGIAVRPLAAVAAGAGYSDQAHLTREFRALVGLSPGEYRAAMPAPGSGGSGSGSGGNHVPLAAGGHRRR